MFDLFDTSPFSVPNGGTLSHCRICRYAHEVGSVVAGWGNHGEFYGRFRDIVRIVPHLHCLTVTELGHPYRLLYLKENMLPYPFEIQP